MLLIDIDINSSVLTVTHACKFVLMVARIDVVHYRLMIHKQLWASILLETDLMVCPKTNTTLFSESICHHLKKTRKAMVRNTSQEVAKPLESPKSSAKVTYFNLT